MRTVPSSTITDNSQTPHRSDAPDVGGLTSPHALSRRAGAIVLVHGAWVGEWCWEPVVELLADHGRAVHAASLTGHGIRRHQNGPHVTLADHVADVVSLVEVHDLVDITLVAHSYGGRVITRAWPALASRVARMIYLDAHAPLGTAAPGVDTADGARPDSPGPTPAMIPFHTFEPDPDYLGGQDGLRWFRDRLVAQSAATLTESFHVDLPDDLDKTYVAAAVQPDPRFTAYSRAAAAHPAWQHHVLDGDHWLMLCRPHEVARIILGQPATDQGATR